MSTERMPPDSEPVAAVVAQVRFASVLSVSDPSFVAPFQEAIRRAYPLLDRVERQGVDPGADGAPATADSAAWRFSDIRRDWQVTLAEDGVSLACSAGCGDREGLLSRFAEILDAVGVHIGPSHVNRVSVRCVDRSNEPEAAQRLSEFIRPELFTPAVAELGKSVSVGCVVQAEFDVHDVRLVGRWDHVPQGASDAVGWILDLEAFAEETKPFDPAGCAADARRCADIVWGVIRWAVPDQPRAAAGSRVRQLKDDAALTWDQVRQLFGVSRRAVHMWACGARMNSRNEERLTELLQVVSRLGTSPQQRREALMTARDGAGRSLFQELLLETGPHQRVDVEALLGSTGAGETIHGKFLFAEVIRDKDTR